MRRTMKKKLFSVKLTEDTINRIRRAVYWTPGLTMFDVCENALINEVRKWEALNPDKVKGVISLKKGSRVQNPDL